MWIPVCVRGNTPSVRGQLGKGSEHTPELNVAVCLRELRRGLIDREGFLGEVVTEQKLNGREGGSRVTIRGKSISGWGKERSAKALRYEEYEKSHCVCSGGDGRAGRTMSSGRSSGAESWQGGRPQRGTGIYF